MSITEGNYKGEKLKPMLLSEYPDHVKMVKKQGYVFMQPKLDGWRAYANTQTGEIFSRSGRELDLPHISTAIKAACREGSPEWIDGELYRQGSTLGEIQSMIKKQDDRLQFHIFDCMIDKGFFDRSSILKAQFNFQYVFLIPVETYVVHYRDIMRYYKNYLNQGYEGAVVRIDGRPYEQHRSFQALKMTPEIM